MDKNTRNSWDKLNPLFKSITDLPEVRSRLGVIKQGKSQVERQAAGADKKPAEIKSKKQAKKGGK